MHVTNALHIEITVGRLCACSHDIWPKMWYERDMDIAKATKMYHSSAEQLTTSN